MLAFWQFVFSSFWVWLGTVILILTIGFSGHVLIIAVTTVVKSGRKE